MYFPPKHNFLKEQEFIQKQYERIVFEYRVLKQSNKRIAIVNDKRGRPLAIVTID
jgi:rRNA maturation protein Rpf1